MMDLMAMGLAALGLVGAMVPWSLARKSAPKELVLLDHTFNTTADKDKARRSSQSARSCASLRSSATVWP